MQVSRRNFLKYCLGSAAALGLSSSVLGSLEKVFAAGGGPPILWLSAASCTGCTVSLANRVSTSKPTDVADLLINSVNLAYHPNLMGAAGDLAVSTLRTVVNSKNYILAVEGGFPQPSMAMPVSCGRKTARRLRRCKRQPASPPTPGLF